MKGNLLRPTENEGSIQIQNRNTSEFWSYTLPEAITVAE